MKLVKLNVNKHDLKKVAGLIYETDAETLNFYFKNKEKAAELIQKLIQADGGSGENTYVTTGDDNQVYGVLVAFKGDEESIKTDLKAYFKNLSFINALKFTLLEISYIFIGVKIDKDDYYLSDVAVDENCRGRGVGTFILEKSLELAREKGCKRAVLDVDLKNEGALRLYKRMGFKIFNKKSIRWFGGEKGVYNMEYWLNQEMKQ